MYSILLVIIYISFISLGLPDSLLGSAWPIMHGELGVPVGYAGILSMIISGMTIISSLMSVKVIHRFGTGKVTAVSVAMTAVALFGFSISGSFWMLCLWAIPYGLGAGSVDTALNNFVALHYKARHMSWLHCFWGLGASVGPYIMGACLTRGLGWSKGYGSISVIQVVLTIALFFSLPLWNKQNGTAEAKEEEHEVVSLRKAVKIPGALSAMLAFLCYCAVESTAGLWGASYMVLFCGISNDTAAKWASFFYVGITIGRFICGFITMKFKDKTMVRMGQVIMLTGIALLLLNISHALVGAGLIIIGIGCAPVYPSFIHATPAHFGAKTSQSLMGIQMASAYVGSTFVPPVFGLIAEHINIRWYPIFLLLFVILMIVMAESLNRKTVEEKI